MILIDTRIGSRDLIPVLGDLATGCVLSSADIAFNGFDPNTNTDSANASVSASNKTVTIGIEAKELEEMISSAKTGRLQDQLVSMLDTYDVVYLAYYGIYREYNDCVEIFRYGKWAKLEHREGSRNERNKYVKYQYLQQMLLSITAAGVIVIRLHSKEELVSYIKNCYTWWNKKEHKFFRTFKSHTEIAAHNKKSKLRILNSDNPRTVSRAKILAGITGISYERALGIARVYPSVRAVAETDVEILASTIIGKRRLGVPLAQAVWSALNS